jgi:hypothetical protein
MEITARCSCRGGINAPFPQCKYVTFSCRFSFERFATGQLVIEENVV